MPISLTAPIVSSPYLYVFSTPEQQHYGDVFRELADWVDANRDALLQCAVLTIFPEWAPLRSGFVVAVLTDRSIGTPTEELV